MKEMKTGSSVLIVAFPVIHREAVSESRPVVRLSATTG
jgi:hypothetical protein